MHSDNFGSASCFKFCRCLELYDMSKPIMAWLPVAMGQLLSGRVVAAGWWSPAGSSLLLAGLAKFKRRIL